MSHASRRRRGGPRAMWSRVLLRRCRQAWINLQLVGIVAALAACGLTLYDHVGLARERDDWRAAAQHADDGLTTAQNAVGACQAQAARAFDEYVRSGERVEDDPR